MPELMMLLQLTANSKNVSRFYFKASLLPLVGLIPLPLSITVRLTDTFDEAVEGAGAIGSLGMMQFGTVTTMREPEPIRP